MLKSKSKILLTAIVSGAFIIGALISIMIATADEEKPQFPGKVLVSASMPKDKLDKYKGSNLVKNSYFIGKVKITKVKEKGTEKGYDMLLDPDSIGAEKGHKSYKFMVKYDIYEADVLDGIKNPDNKKTIEIYDLGLIDAGIKGDITQCQLEVGNEYFLYLDSTKESEYPNRYRFVSLIDGIFKIQKDGKTMRNATSEEDVEKHKMFVKDNM